MKNLDVEHLERELALQHPGAKVVHLANDGFYAIYPTQLVFTDRPRRGYAQMEYLGGTYADALREIQVLYQVQ